MAVNVNLELTDHCNLRCTMCSQALRDEAHGVPKRFMAWDTWRAALKNLADMPDEVHLCPHWLGEPTVHPRFEEMVEYAFAMNAGNRLFRTFKLHTNGVLLGADRCRRLLRLAALPDQAPGTFAVIHWSLDAFSRGVYSALKGGDHRDRVWQNVHAFLDLRARAGATWPHAHLAFVVQPENVAEVGDFVEYWSAVLARTGTSWNLTGDWPSMEHDAIYLRPLNCADQRSADQLHAAACSRVGVRASDGRLRAAESF